MNQTTPNHQKSHSIYNFTQLFQGDSPKVKEARILLNLKLTFIEGDSLNITIALFEDNFIISWKAQQFIDKLKFI